MFTRDARATRLSMGGAILAALATSSCCLGPLLLAAVGIGGAGAIAALGVLRPYLLVVTIALVATGFYFTYREARPVEGDGCGCERPVADRAGRMGLWVATVVVILVAAAPPLLARWESPKLSGVASSATLETVTILVRGIDCAACARPIRAALTEVGGFHSLLLDIANQRMAVTYEPQPERLAAYVAAIDELGYEAKVPDARKKDR